MDDKSKSDGMSSLESIVAKMPSTMAEHLTPRDGGFFDMYWRSKPTGAVYGETQDYKVVVAKWNEHEWSTDGGGIQWKEWLEIYFTKKGAEDISVLKTEEIVTRDQYHESKDKRYLWFFDDAGLIVQDKNSIVVSWKNKDGDSVKPYRFSLDDEIKM